MRLPPPSSNHTAQPQSVQLRAPTTTSTTRFNTFIGIFDGMRNAAAAAVATFTALHKIRQDHRLSTLLGPRSRFWDESLGIRLVCPQIRTAVLKGVTQWPRGQLSHNYSNNCTHKKGGAVLISGQNQLLLAVYCSRINRHSRPRAKSPFGVHQHHSRNGCNFLGQKW